MNILSEPAPTIEDLDALLARIAESTRQLREGVPDAAARETERAIVSDLKRVAGILRAGVTTIGDSLTRVLDDERAIRGRGRTG